MSELLEQDFIFRIGQESAEQFSEPSPLLYQFPLHPSAKFLGVFRLLGVSLLAAFLGFD